MARRRGERGCGGTRRAARGRSAGLAASCQRPLQPPSLRSGPCLYKERESGGEHQGNESAVLLGGTGRAGCAAGGAARRRGPGAEGLGRSCALLVFQARSRLPRFRAVGVLGTARVTRGGFSAWGVPVPRAAGPEEAGRGPGPAGGGLPAAGQGGGGGYPRSGTAFYVTDWRGGYGGSPAAPAAWEGASPEGCAPGEAAPAAHSPRGDRRAGAASRGAGELSAPLSPRRGRGGGRRGLPAPRRRADAAPLRLGRPGGPGAAAGPLRSGGRGFVYMSPHPSLKGPLGG